MGVHRTLDRILADAKERGITMCSGQLRVGRRVGDPCPCRASTIVDGAALCGNHARLAAEGKLQVRNAVAEKAKRKVDAVKDALYDFLCDMKVELPDKALELMAQDIVMTLENVK